MYITSAQYSAYREADLQIVVCQCFDFIIFEDFVEKGRRIANPSERSLKSVVSNYWRRIANPSERLLKSAAFNYWRRIANPSERHLKSVAFKY